tara:strand:- start:195 stop:611 length:417 start_codon:yes stop_codon:yes gene_type:complete
MLRTVGLFIGAPHRIESFMPREDKEGHYSEVDADDVDIYDIPRKARIAIAETFGGGILGAIIGVIVLSILLSAIFDFISYVHSLNIPFISYIFSPEFREGLGIILFGFVLFVCFVGVLLAICMVAWLWEKIVDLIRFR